MRVETRMQSDVSLRTGSGPESRYRRSRSRWLTSILTVLLPVSVINTNFSVGADLISTSPFSWPESDTFGLAYAAGKYAYTTGRWFECIVHMESALQLFRRHETNVARCREECHRQADREEPLIASSTRSTLDKDNVYIENRDAPSNVLTGRLDLYERTIRDTLCFMRCQKSRSRRTTFETVAADRAAENHILARRPYEYLQLCYYKVGDLQNALSSAYTFLLQNPNHEVMKSNFRFYTSQSGFDLQHIRNLEAQPYQEHFLRGNDAYKRKDFAEVVSSFETALQHYFRAEDKCRLLCEGHFYRGPALDLTMTVANHFTFSLRCKQRCSKELAFIYGEQYDDYLASHFHYLQFAYYQIGEAAKACEAVASHLVFHPDDEVTMHNKDFYATKVNANQQADAVDLFRPRKVVVDYVQRDKDEKLLLTFIEANFATTSDKDDDEPVVGNTPTTGRPQESSPITSRSSLPRNVTLVMAEAELKGTKRFAADGLANTEECQELIRLATEAAVHGDGYDGKTSPHTQFETFEGLTIGRAAVMLFDCVPIKLVSLGLLGNDRVQLLLDVSERGRAYVEHHFRLTNDRLYFSYTHLVCRTANPDSPTNRSDLSHPVHADNCLLKTDGECHKMRPAYTWRDYSAILYLNDNFDGGEFIFAKNKESVQATVRPVCGRLIGFSAGHENTHGVKAVRRGRRCALAMWFTLDLKHRERERFLATQMLAADQNTTTSSASAIVGEPEKVLKHPTPIDELHNEDIGRDHFATDVQDDDVYQQAQSSGNEEETRVGDRQQHSEL